MSICLHEQRIAQLKIYKLNNWLNIEKKLFPKDNIQVNYFLAPYPNIALNGSIVHTLSTVLSSKLMYSDFNWFFKVSCWFINSDNGAELLYNPVDVIYDKICLMTAHVCHINSISSIFAFYISEPLNMRF